MTKEELRAQKAKALRYKKALVRDINLETIRSNLDEMSEVCSDVQWFVEVGDESLLSELVGGEEEAAEFKMEFSILASECEQMYEDLEDAYIPECFDDVFVACGAGDTAGGYLGYDNFEGDYFGLDTWSAENAMNESSKRLQRLTKPQIIDAVHVCMRVVLQYIGLCVRYDSLKAAMDVIRGSNQSYLKIVKEIDEQYDKAEKERFYPYSPETRKLQKLFDALPAEVWVY